MMDGLYRRISSQIDWELIEKEVNMVVYSSGIYVPVDMEILIGEIYLSPTAPEWQRDVISAVCKKFDINRVPVRSDLMTEPVR